MSSATADVLVVDDQEPVRAVLNRVLDGAGYECRQAASVPEARSLVADRAPHLVLCDIDMPETSGFELVDWLSDHHPDTAVVMVTGYDDPLVADRALAGGAYGYIIKPFERNEIIINVASALRRRELEVRARSRRAALESLVDERTLHLRQALVDLERAAITLEDSYKDTVWRLAAAAEHRDPETAYHLERMSRYSELLARAAGLDDERCRRIAMASPMHDVGKIGIPDEVLMNTGVFSDEDRQIMIAHAELGHRILDGSPSPLLQTAATIALTHHERWDGTGYPYGISREAIPIEGRIVAIADVFDALTSERRYKKAMSVQQARFMMLAEKGAHFDPMLVELFFSMVPDIERIRRRYQDST